jgi:hypothetical protein
MALHGPDGEQINHISERRPEAGGLPGEPDRGQRVGVGVGENYRRVDDPMVAGGGVFRRRDPEPLPLGSRYSTDEETLRVQYETDRIYALTTARTSAHHNIQHLLEHQPMIAEQRRILVMALGVLGTFA